MPLGIFVMLGAYIAPQVNPAMPGPKSATLIGTILGALGESIIWSGATLLGFELATRRVNCMRWIRKPARSHIASSHPAEYLILPAFVAIYTAIAAMTRSFIPLALVAWIAAIYIVTTGIHRRTGWDRRCANCGYPHPDPKPYPITCPECGRTLRPDSYKDIVLGRNVRSVPRIAIGLCLLAGLAAMVALT